MEYLEGRGIGEREVRTHRLGVVGNPFVGHGKFRGFLTIPYLSRHGYPVAIRFRCLEPHNHREHGHGKYMSMTGEPPRMYNVGAIIGAGEEIHVAEGELDCVVLNSIGLPAVAIPGALIWRPRHRVMLSGFNRIYVWADPDDAGAELAGKIGRSLQKARTVRLQEGDVTDTYLAGGAEALLSLLPERSV